MHDWACLQHVRCAGCESNRGRRAAVSSWWWAAGPAVRRRPPVTPSPMVLAASPGVDWARSPVTRHIDAARHHSSRNRHCASGLQLFFDTVVMSHPPALFIFIGWALCPILYTHDESCQLALFILSASATFRLTYAQISFLNLLKIVFCLYCHIRPKNNPDRHTHRIFRGEPQKGSNLNPRRAGARRRTPRAGVGGGGVFEHPLLIRLLMPLEENEKIES